MLWIKQTGVRLFRLFVDDGRLASVTIGWVAISAFALPFFVASEWKGPVEFAGFAVILLENVLRSARQLRRH
jgi:hypothetical protein